MKRLFLLKLLFQINEEKSQLGDLKYLQSQRVDKEYQSLLGYFTPSTWITWIVWNTCYQTVKRFFSLSNFNNLLLCTSCSSFLLKPITGATCHISGARFNSQFRGLSWSNEVNYRESKKRISTCPKGSLLGGGGAVHRGKFS